MNVSAYSLKSLFHDVEFINHDVVYKNHDMVYKNHDMVYIFHVKERRISYHNNAF